MPCQFRVSTRRIEWLHMIQSQVSTDMDECPFKIRTVRTGVKKNIAWCVLVATIWTTCRLHGVSMAFLLSFDNFDFVPPIFQTTFSSNFFMQNFLQNFCKIFYRIFGRNFRPNFGQTFDPKFSDKFSVENCPGIWEDLDREGRATRGQWEAATEADT